MRVVRSSIASPEWRWRSAAARPRPHGEEEDAEDVGEGDVERFAALGAELEGVVLDGDHGVAGRGGVPEVAGGAARFVEARADRVAVGAEGVGGADLGDQGGGAAAFADAQGEGDAAWAKPMRRKVRPTAPSSARCTVRQ